MTFEIYALYVIDSKVLCIREPCSEMQRAITAIRLTINGHDYLHIKITISHIRKSKPMIVEWTAVMAHYTPIVRTHQKPPRFPIVECTTATCPFDRQEKKNQNVERQRVGKPVSLLGLPQRSTKGILDFYVFQDRSIYSHTSTKKSEELKSQKFKSQSLWLIYGSTNFNPFGWSVMYTR